MKSISVSNTIKLLGALLILTIFVVIGVTIYLNQKNIKDALAINIAGKQRMLSQKITKDILFLYQSNSHDFTKIDNAVSEFQFGINTIKNGNANLQIKEAPSDEIKHQIERVEILWKAFEKNIEELKSAVLNNDPQKINSLVKYFQNTNDQLLFEVDQVVNYYTQYVEEKNSFIRNFQYTAFAFLFVFALYALIQLKQIETHARDFMEKYKQLGLKDIEELEPIAIDSEKEFVEMADHMNCFISKVASAVNYSQNALEQSRLASEKLESLTDEFDSIINEIENKSEVMGRIGRSEDIVIESTEELLKSTKKLQKLKSELDALLQNCKVPQSNQNETKV